MAGQRITTHVKLIEMADMTWIGDPRQVAVQHGTDDYGFVDCDFCA